MATTSELDPRVAALLAAESERREIERIDPDSKLSEDDAYRLQFDLIAAKVARGDKVIGLKTGLTSLAKQATMGVHQPIFGHLLASTVVPEGEPVRCDQLIHPRAEPELAFLLAEGLDGYVTAAQACAATTLVFPAVEIIDSRFANFRFGLTDVIADNTSASRVIFGSNGVGAMDIDLRMIGMVYTKNGNVESTAAGAAILGNPWEALAWLARRASQLGRPLKGGDMVLAGALADAVFVNAGDNVRVEFAGLGGLNVTFV
ncbi:MAG TPA: fumarylacetoacetate hydrolase family protein [Dehalococcoidia bacterium]|nr:fumarylacetoacetate hydrolase family protein [Dehalococcoidia bacterium]